MVDEVVARDGRECFARHLIRHRCRGPLDAHEVIPRSAWPGGHLVAGNIRLLCRVAHDWVGANPAKAADLALHGWSWDRPS